MDTQTELARLRAIVERRKPKGKYYKSRLDKWKDLILKLDAEGATLSMIQVWLQEKNIRVHKSTISRWLNKQGNKNA